jgi:5-formyltetrahydrofolate cyclo-ligase
VTTPSREAKAAFRQKILERLEGMSPTHRAEASALACKVLERQQAWQRAQSILFYASTALELDVWRLVEDSLAAGKLVALPRYEPSGDRYAACRIQNAGADLAAGRFGIREPAAHCEQLDFGRIDLVLVPGVAFDNSGRRLGRGKGYYDRLLEQAQSRTCGVAFDEQVVTELPHEAHDIQVDSLVTPSWFWNSAEA